MDFDGLEPLVDRIEDEFDPILGEVDDQVHVQGILDAVQDLDGLDRAHLGLDGSDSVAEVHP